MLRASREQRLWGKMCWHPMPSQGEWQVIYFGLAGESREGDRDVRPSHSQCMCFVPGSTWTLAQPWTLSWPLRTFPARWVTKRQPERFLPHSSPSALCIVARSLLKACRHSPGGGGLCPFPYQEPFSQPFALFISSCEPPSSPLDYSSGFHLVSLPRLLPVVDTFPTQNIRVIFWRIDFGHIDFLPESSILGLAIKSNG